MLSTIISVLSLGVILLIIASLIISAWQERRRHICTETIQPHLPFHGIPEYPTVVPETSKSIVMGVDKRTPQSLFTLPSSWYRRRRTFVSLSFLILMLLALFVQSGLADGALRDLGKGVSFLSAFQASATDIHFNAHYSLQGSPSQRLVRISQLDPNQYDSSAEYNTWAYSACSAASMTEVFNAYGHHFRITDILKVEAQIGEITPTLGLVRPEGVEHTAAQFGFKTDWGNDWTLDKVINYANSGKPVIVSFPPDRYDGGHILVVIGGTSDTVYLADTSLWNRHSLPRWQFLQWWEGFAAVVTPT